MSCNCNQNTQIEEAIRSGVRKALREKNQSKNSLKSIVKEAVREMLSEEDDYQAFVESVMETMGIDSPQDLTEEGRSKFFEILGDNYNEDTDEADDVPTEELRNKMDPSDFKGEAPDFLKKEEHVRKSVRKALKNVLN